MRCRGGKEGTGRRAREGLLSRGMTGRSLSRNSASERVAVWCYRYSRGRGITFPNAVIVGWIDDCPTTGLEDDFGKLDFAGPRSATFILPVGMYWVPSKFPKTGCWSLAISISRCINLFQRLQRGSGWSCDTFVDFNITLLRLAVRESHLLSYDTSF
jgi:hypothetical protein